MFSAALVVVFVNLVIHIVVIDSDRKQSKEEIEIMYGEIERDKGSTTQEK